MDLFTYYNTDKKERESFYLYGYLNDDITYLLSKINSVKNQDLGAVNKRISFLTVETFQNIVRHGHGDSEFETNEKTKRGMFLYAQTENGIVLGSANQVLNSKVAGLEKQITELNTLNSEELKTKYSDSLVVNERSKDGGAGFGFLSILRKTKGKIYHQIKPINDQVSNFIFQSNLKLFGDTEPEFITENRFQFMDDNKILIYRKGVFDHSSMVLMTNLLNLNLKLNVESDFGKKLFFGVGELIQNIYSHGCDYDGGKSGVFLVKKEANNLTICSGNFVKNREVNTIQSYFDLLNKLNEEGLQKLYQEKLFSPVEFNNDPFNSGIGLIEIKKHTNNPIKYNFAKVNDEISFLSLSINYIAEI
ncbi:MAG: DUF6272 family protein [Putridiphycobacter sp.]